MTNKNQVLQLFTPIYDEFMLATYKEDAQVGPKLFEQITDKTSEYKVDDLGGLGEWEDADEAAGGNFEDVVLGYPTTLTQAKYRKRFSVSFEAVDQDEYALLNKVSDAKNMGRGARAKQEKLLSALVYGVFATAGSDGQYWADTDHPKNREETGITYSNLLSGPLSHDNLELAEKQIADNLIGPDGIMIEVSENPILLYAPANNGNAMRITADRADYRPGVGAGSANSINEINRFAGKYNPMSWKYLSAAAGGSDTMWAILFPELGYMKQVWSAKPHYRSWIEEDEELYVFSGRMLSAQNLVNWRAGFFSTGL
jgi:hypothetical protein